MLLVARRLRCRARVSWSFLPIVARRAGQEIPATADHA